MDFCIYLTVEKIPSVIRYIGNSDEVNWREGGCVSSYGFICNSCMILFITLFIIAFRLIRAMDYSFSSVP